jgi:DNA-directed RNA polymerase subunit N (RpoN/RPB10)
LVLLVGPLSWPFKKQHVSSVRFPSVEKTVMQQTAFPTIAADPCCIQRHSQALLQTPAAFSGIPKHCCRPLLHSAAFPTIAADPYCIQRHSQALLQTPAAFSGIPKHCCRPLLNSFAFPAIAADPC